MKELPENNQEIFAKYLYIWEIRESPFAIHHDSIN